MKSTNPRRSRLTRLVASLILAVLVLGLATLWRLSARDAAALAATPPSGQFLTIDDAKLHVVVKGSGPDLVLIHGASGTLRDYTFALVDQLAPRYRVIAVDRPGMGYSDPLPQGDTSLASQADRIRRALDAFGVKNPIVLGQSYGGAVALAWAVDSPPAALVLVGGVSMPWPGPLDPWYRATSPPLGRATLVPLVAAFMPHSYVTRAIDGVFAPDAAPAGYAQHLGLDLTLRRATLATNVAQINALRDHVVAMEPRYANLTLPIEMIHGDADTIVPLDVHAARFAPLVPSATLTVLPGAGHMPHHSHTAEVIAAIDRAALRAGLR
jgi:pimeloyl-ACP methyl ester carboxylesterase